MSTRDDPMQGWFDLGLSLSLSLPISLSLFLTWLSPATRNCGQLSKANFPTNALSIWVQLEQTNSPGSVPKPPEVNYTCLLDGK